MIKKIYLTLTDISTKGQSGPESNAYKEVLFISQDLKLEPHLQIHFRVKPRTHVV